MNIAEKIKTARKQAGLSQQELADQLHVSRSAIAKWEAGNGLPDLENLRALSRLFGISLDILADDSADSMLCTLREKIVPEIEPDEAVRLRWPEAVQIDRMYLMHDFKRLGRVINFLTFGWLGSIWRLVYYGESYRDRYYLVDAFVEHIFVRFHEGELYITPLGRRVLRSERENFCHQGRTYMGGGKM